MPIVNIQISEGRTVDQKRKMVEGITKVLVEEGNVKNPDGIRIIFNEIKPENLGKGYKLAKDI